MKQIAGILFVVSIFLSCQSQTTELSLSLEQGETYTQVSNAKATVIQEINGQVMNMEMVIKGKMTYLVENVSADGYELETKFDNLSMSMQTPQGAMDFSSEKDDETDIFSSILASMKNKSFTVNMSKQGKITEVTGVEKIWENAFDNFENLSEMQKEQIKAQVMQAYGAEALKGNTEMVTAIYPKEPVNEGDIWTIETNLESGMAAKMSTDYELVEVSDDFAFIKGNATIKTEDKDAYIENNGMPMKYDMEGTMTSEIKVDKKTGWIIEAKMHQEMQGVAHIKENPQMPEGMKIPMTMKNETLITH